ncbi:MAG TPA: ParB/RepB/Spo0J family partition protein [Ktedonobacterales bacterium]|nr:ParB/RepB/Spo0J family partition protein [Ktedonobacterales bacterium]
MAKPRFGLGRGLDALIPGAEVAPEESAPLTPIPQAAPLEVPIGSIFPNPRQPRTYITEDDALRELADSIREHGVIQPLVVTELIEDGQSSRPVDGDKPLYQLIAGERRWQASKLAGLVRVPVIIREVTPQQMLELALIENIQRSDLNPIEEALAYRDLVNDFSLTHEEVGRRVGKSRETISNAIRLLALPIDARQKLASRSQEFTPGHARAVLRIQNEDAQREAIERITAQGLTVRAAEELARRYAEVATQQSQPEHKSQPQQSVSGSRLLEDEFRKALMMKIQLRQNAKGNGSLTIFFTTEEELHRLYEIIVARQDA